MGIEPTSKAWEALVLPLNYTRAVARFYANLFRNFKQLQANFHTNNYIKSMRRLTTIHPPLAFEYHQRLNGRRVVACWGQTTPLAFVLY